uniref:NADH dehydrogenase subunit 6 n=1 Tax=Ectomomyrmex javanus TaxID=2571052 RepID=A0A4D6P0F5_9HYME|nr:NADH dehydrogenase subunit 6 [Ectomomyrmex javanus]QCE31832.1 NADH dehydrogenase subunit 6 [Ectomomyrmex javanus]
MIKLIQSNFFILWLIMFMIIIFIMNQSIHPIMLMILMIFFNLLIFLNMSIWKINFIYSIMLFLIMISGLLIIFMYFSSLISNEQMKLTLKVKLFYLMNLNIMIPFMFLFLYNYIILNQLYFLNFDQMSFSSINLNKFFNLIFIYYFPYMNITLLSMFFLLLTFISIIKINSTSLSMSLRKIN